MSKIDPVALLPFSLPSRDIQSTNESISNLTDVSLKITKHLLTTEGKEKNMVYLPLSIQSTKESISNLTDVSLKITKQLLTTDGKDKNMVYSPLSIQVVLWLLTAGSKGPTKEQLLSFLKSKSVDELNSLSSHLVPLIFADGSARGGPCLSFANGLWVEESVSIKPSFKKVVETVHKAAIKQVNFRTNPEEARAEVNAWAKKATQGLIKDVLGPGTINNKTTLIAANAIYFKGVWSDPFDASETEECRFYLLDGTFVKAPLMRSYGDRFVKVFDGFKILKLPYEQGEDEKRQFAMHLLLPDARDGLPALVERVCSQHDFLDCRRPEPLVPVRLFKMPRFKITSGFEASDILKDLGLLLPFSDDGELTEMVESPRGKARLIHKSFIEVDEEGTKAAAVTVVDIQFSLHDDEPTKMIDFVADHPFLFFIREEMTGTVLFIGHVLNPLERR
ncbi:hypothetical protein ACFX14_036040 [Malus domestica]